MLDLAKRVCSVSSGQLHQQNSADITFILVMLLAVEEQVFATLAGALLKQTNRKKKGGGEKKIKRQKQYPQVSGCSWRGKTLNYMFISTKKMVAQWTTLFFFFKLLIFPNGIFWKKVTFLEVYSSSKKSWKLRLSKTCILACQPHLCAYVHTDAFVCTFLN